MSIPAAWHPDPTGRHEYRYWDGQRWTEHVANAGQRAIDPVDGRPAANSGQQAPVQAAHVEQSTQPAAQPAQPAAQPAEPVAQPATPTPVDDSAQASGTEPAMDDSTNQGPGASTAEAAGATPSSGETTSADASTSPSSEQVTPPATSGDSSASSDDEGAQSAAAPATSSHLYAVDQAASEVADGTDAQATTSRPTEGDAGSPQDPASALAAPPPIQNDAASQSANTADGTRPEIADDDGDPTEPSFQPATAADISDIEDQESAGGDKRARRAAKKSSEASSGGPRRDSLGNGPAVAALILGVVAVLVALVPFVGVIAVPLGLVAVVLGFLGRRRGQRSGMGKGTATTGLMTGAAGMILGAAITVLFVWVVQQSAFGINELAACIDQTGDAGTCSQQFQSAFFDQLFGRS